jgi:polyisoprenoid-binding protein YceI
MEQAARRLEPTRWELDAAHSTVGFSVKHMMFTTVRGKFTEVTGVLELDPSHPESSRVEVEIPVASIDTGIEKRDAHLRSPDFLDAEAYPFITFRSRRVERAQFRRGARFRVVGDLTIRGVTREVKLDTAYEGMGRDPGGQERMGFSASTKIDRRDYGLTWNQPLETGGVLVGNEVQIEIEAQVVGTA